LPASGAAKTFRFSRRTHDRTALGYDPVIRATRS
jgi:hypothetical protein